MKRWLKRIRGAAGMGLTWAAAWFGVGAIFMAVMAVFGLNVGRGLPGLVGTSVVFAIVGFIVGAAFSSVLRFSAGRRRFDEMSLWRFAGWGAQGGLLVSMIFFLRGGRSSVLEGVLLAGLFTLLGAGSAAGSLALARKADDRELLEHGADVADIGLTEEEKRDLLLGK